MSMPSPAGVPDPSARFPLPSGDRSLAFLNQVVRHPQVEIGDFTYYHDEDDATGFMNNVKYLYELVGDRLVIGKFCLIASGATFLMNGGSHPTDSVATYPFGIFGGAWASARRRDWPSKGDTTIGSDVWIGYRATLLPGTSLGHGAVIGAHAVVSGAVPPYAIVVGNPGRIIRYRHSQRDIETLLEIAWWDWPIEQITAAVELLSKDDVPGLRDFARGRRIKGATGS